MSQFEVKYTAILSKYFIDNYCFIINKRYESKENIKKSVAHQEVNFNKQKTIKL